MAPVARSSTSRIAKPSLHIKVGSRPGTVQGEKSFLDRWSPKIDQDHYDRVRLYRRRKETVSRHQKTQEHRRTYISRASESDASALPPTDMSQSSVAFSDLGSTFQDELDNYDEQIQTLQKGEWPTPPQPKTTLRIGGPDPQKRAKELKEWGFVQGMMWGGNSATLRDSDRVHPASSYRIGVIFSAPHHTAGSSEANWIPINDPYQTATPFGVVHSKFRKMVVVKVFGEHVICVPIYSHNGKGLEGKVFIKEYVSIRDVADKKPMPPEGLHLKLLAIANPDFLGRVVSGKSSVKLTEFCSHRFISPATMEGELESNSTKRLVELVNLLGG
ncbi:hypothetical protein O1611_g4346 [Lasiodiplodia mahajangana]|uniref:Uncharacterized protein n=1 Tax=Lasiodiplodia mahajangana TaxID=1108764 RepID=A0ACC2JP49_9PEZI|nr:hypothetical protein O1611_g4346 [Lasiodiplodia mahajangana]